MLQLPLAVPTQHGFGNADQSTQKKKKKTALSSVSKHQIHIHKHYQDNNYRINKSYLKILGNFTNKPLEREFPNQELSTLLILTDFTALHDINILTFS
jgi:hypothetical protein